MAWNEPGGEKRNPWNRPQNSQNDLDDVLRNLQRRLAALFGRGGSGNGGVGQGTPSFSKGFGAVAVLIGAVWLSSGAYRVDAQERAVVLRFGAYVKTVGPGYNWHMPWPIERKVIVNASRTMRRCSPPTPIWSRCGLRFNTPSRSRGSISSG
jgi:membrane protease subunit HflK